MRKRISVCGLLAAIAWLGASPSLGQGALPSPPTPSPTPAVTSVPKLTDVAPPEEAATVRYGNRPTVLLRGQLLGRAPADRARAAVRRIEEASRLGLAGPVDVRFVEGVAIITVAGREAVTILPTDVDGLAGETLEATAAEAARSLRRALAEVVEARTPRLLLRGALWALAATLGALLVAWALWWARRRVARRFKAWLDERVVPSLERQARADLWRTAESRLVGAAMFGGRLLLVALSLLLAYVWLTIVLRQFPYTRPWGEALRGFVLTTLATLGGGMLAALPGLFTVALIVVITRLIVRGTNALFQGVEQGRVALPGVHPETAQPTRRLARTIHQWRPSKAAELGRLANPAGSATTRSGMGRSVTPGRSATYSTLRWATRVLPQGADLARAALRLRVRRGGSRFAPRGRGRDTTPAGGRPGA
jgi:hypothetical protein